MRRLLAISILLAWFPARADYHYASHDGSDEYPYTSWETAADSIQNAIDASSPHDTVYVGSGDWDEAVAMQFYDSVAVLGMGVDSTYWHTDEYRTPALAIGNACSVQYITFRHPDWRPLEYLNGGPSASTRNCRFMNSHWGISMNGGISEVVNCVFDSCEKAVGVLDFSGHFIIRNNLILNTLGYYALDITSSSSLIENNIIIYGPSVSAIAAEDATIRNNIIIQAGTGSGISTTYHSIKYNNTVKDVSMINRAGINAILNDTLTNNLIINCDRGITVEDSCLVSYNAFWNNETDIVDWSNGFDSVGNIFRDPMLISDNDVHLQAFSPCIDAGAPYLYDPDSSRSDIGAYGGPYGESYNYLDLPPTIPDSLSGEIVADTVFINWGYNTEADFDHYYLHRDTVSGFTPSSFNLIAEPDSSYYEDMDVTPGQSYYYRISALDNQGNLSDYSDELAVIPTGMWDGLGVEPPRITAIDRSYPNPFNSQTTMIYYVANLGPIPAEIRIEIYDVLGRKVRTLLDDRKELGTYRITWDGRDDSGMDCPSGVYFASISQWGLKSLSKPVKMVLIK